MSTTTKLARLISIGITVVGAGGACAQDYPSKPIRIVTSEIGGNGDINARLIAPGLASAFGQPVIVENRGGTIIPAQTVAKATPDGYTLLNIGVSFWTGPLLQKMPYDPVTEFSPITLTVNSPTVLVVHPSVPAKTVKELIALAKAKPGELNYASSQTGAATHLGAELFKDMAGVDIVRIVYKGTGPALNDLLGGRMQVMFSSAAAVTPHLKSGKLRGIAVCSAQPSALFPGLPTVASSGLPGYASGSMQGVFAPAKTPAVPINRLNQEIGRFLNTAEVKEQLLNLGQEAIPSSPQQFAAVIKSEMTRLGKLIKDIGITPD